MRVANKPCNTIKKLLSNLKPTIQLEENINTVFKIDCLHSSMAHMSVNLGNT